ncbi:hypothetical protein ACV56Z_05530 [Staphylococcus aureus]
MHLDRREGGISGSHGVGSKYVRVIIIMVIKDMVQQLLESIDHLAVNTRAG